MVCASKRKRTRAIRDEDESWNPKKTVLEEKEMIEELNWRRPLMSVGELAKGTSYTDPLFTGWKPPLHIRRISLQKSDSIRTKLGIRVDGQDVPPPIPTFPDMRFPPPILNNLRAQGIAAPTPIQAQALPVILSGRDMIGIAYTGSGKTLAFVLPSIMVALAEEMIMPLAPGEGPLALVLCPSRELARQTYQVLHQYLLPLNECGGLGYPQLRALLCTGGADMSSQSELVKKKGVHIVIATPGRLKDMLGKKRLNLDHCRYFTLDEADRLLDSGFEEDIRYVLDHFKAQRQTLLFSATMPPTVRNFAATALVKPVTVNLGRAGAANLDVIQEVEYVKQEDRILQILTCLEKTQPPVLIFCENKCDVDRIHEFLLLKGLNAVAIHGGMDQEDREYAIASFKAGKKDILVATDVVSKGLDFPHIRHVINYDMPAQIENYVHRIGRTGRCGRTGVATTFINRSQSETTLLDLKHLLQEAKQKIPPVLAMLEDVTPISDANGVKGCAYCGGLGHRLHECPKLQHHKSMAIRRDCFGYNNEYKCEI